MFEKGSEWRRWDLHIHTPGTKKSDKYQGKSIEQKWDNFYSALNAYVEDQKDEIKQVAVLGITDYCSIDNYLKVVSDNKLSPKILQIFPNVEMRIIPTGTNSPVNIHFIFSPEIVCELEERFFSVLKFQNGEGEYSCTRMGLIRLGKSLGAKDDKEAYIKGVDNFVLSYKDIYDVFQRDPGLREKTLIGVANKSTDGASGIDRGENGGQLLAAKKAVYRLCDFIFSGYPGDATYFLGNGVDSRETVIKEYGSLKPCIHGSDAHCLENLLEPSNRRYCWIKADTSFNGLKQVIYEPEGRVRIAEIKPEEKSDYYVIEKVEVEDSDFSTKPIYFNDKLTCIIGGKSTGKSLLLQNIARTIDSKQVDEKLEISKVYSKKLGSVKVYWRDGDVNINGEVDLNHKIVYIPQTYLNRLTDEGEKASEIDKIIHDIIILDPNCKLVFEKMEDEIKTLKPDLDKKIYDLLQIDQEIRELLSERNEIGTDTGIKKELEKLEKQKEIISKKSAISDEELNLYDGAIKKLAESEAIIKKCELDIRMLSELQFLIQPVAPPQDLSEDIISDISGFQQSVIEEFHNRWIVKREEIITKILLRKEDAASDLKRAIDVKNKLTEKVLESEALTKITERIKNEQIKLENVITSTQKISNKKERYMETLGDIANAIENYRAIHARYAEFVNSNVHNNDSEGLDFSVKVVFKTEAFISMLSTNINNNSLKKNNIILDNFEETQFTAEFVFDLIDKIIKEDVKLLRNKTVESVVRELLNDWFFISYDVKMENDNINQMSPGKKALVLLKMLISMADSKCPILIDQPEDDLDNRSIFDELIPFIRKKKVSRQIIIVTHNANVVLGGDAEEIIIANQSGNNSKNEKFRFEYRSGSIENDLSVVDESGSIKEGILNEKGIQQHICDILEGGERAFDLRKNKYRI